ncbi:MAG: 2-oxoacid:acceptor oxidoreductase subunit alpha [Candidatus Pacebacteria bacterium]|nr:2-oxoacid:acceptor oxidoreductase subunit alpha [Candidatus Paceibacterota bacterium]
MQKEYSIIIGGAAGLGSKKAGNIIAQLFSGLGYKIYIYEDYQSLVKGGHNFSLVRASSKTVGAIKEKVDFVIALDELTSSIHSKQLKDKNNIIYNADKFSLKYGVPVFANQITKENGGLDIMQNTALVGAFAKVVGLDWNYAKKVFKKEFPVSTETNIQIAQTAYKSSKTLLTIPKISNKIYPLLTGNQATAMGALNAGLDAYVAYPMTPATGILNYLSSVDKITVFQSENEIAAANSVMGFSFIGKRAMTGTSGGGFALMNEAIALSAQSETPLVIVNGQRMGPSTGVPTYNSQSDLLHVLSAGPGDFERFVVAPGDTNEAFTYSALALDIAWKYQLPSIIILDKDLCEGTYSCDFDYKKSGIKPSLWRGKGEYLRYLKTKDGISPLAFPGDKKAVVKGTSYEHDQFGISVEDSNRIKEMQDKRSLKYKEFSKEVSRLKCVNVYGNKKSKTAVIAWGSVKGVAMEMAEELNIKLIQPIVLNPFPKVAMLKALKGVDNLILLELSNSGQMAKLLSCNGINVTKKVLRYDGRPFTIDQLIKIK